MLRLCADVCSMSASIGWRGRGTGAGRGRSISTRPWLRIGVLGPTNSRNSASSLSCPVCCPAGRGESACLSASVSLRSASCRVWGGLDLPVGGGEGGACSASRFSRKVLRKAAKAPLPAAAVLFGSLPPAVRACARSAGRGTGRERRLIAAFSQRARRGSAPRRVPPCSRCPPRSPPVGRCNPARHPPRTRRECWSGWRCRGDPRW